MLNNTKLLKAHGYINGEWIGDNTESRFEVTNAYTNEVISTLPEMGKKDLLMIWSSQALPQDLALQRFQ